MNFLLRDILYRNGVLQIDVIQPKKSDFAFYVFQGSKRIIAKFYTMDNSSCIDVDLEVNKIYCLKLFFRPENKFTANEEDKITKKIFFKLDFNKNVVILIGDILFENENIKITEYNQNSDTTFVTFNSAQTDKTSSPFGVDFVLSNGWNLISLHKHNKNQYQDLNLDLFEKYVKPKTQGKYTYVYGTSLGGYCAFYFGGVLNATIIAGAPMLPVHPLVNHPDYRDVEYKHNKISDNPKTSKPTYIIYDPLEDGDIRFINQNILTAYPNVHFIPVKGGTHLVIKSLQERRIIKDILFDLMGGLHFDAINKIIRFSKLD